LPFIAVMGVAFSLVPSTVWPIVPLIVEESVCGTAFGIMYSLYNLANFTGPILYGFFKDNSGDWTVGNVTFAGYGAVGVLASIALIRYDQKHLYGVLRARSPNAVTFPCLRERSRSSSIDLTGSPSGASRR